MTSKRLEACITSYPGTNSSVAGKVVVRFDADNNDFTFKYRLRNLESNVAGGGVHIHTGTSCEDATLVGGHYWDAGVNETNPDPWTATYGAVYSSDEHGLAKGSFDLNSGYGLEENNGHAVVVHADDGSRVGCGILIQVAPRCRSSHRSNRCSRV